MNEQFRTGARPSSAAETYGSARRAHSAERACSERLWASVPEDGHAPSRVGPRSQWTRVVSLSLLGVGLILNQLPTSAAPPPKREYLNTALRREGDPDRGRALFHDQQRLACAQCHTVDGHSGKAGPDLFAVGDKF